MVYYITYENSSKKILQITNFSIAILNENEYLKENSNDFNTTIKMENIEEKYLLNLHLCKINLDTNEIYFSQELLEEHEKYQKILQKEKYLNAFNKYKIDIVYGIEQESLEEHNMILEWYNKLLELDEISLNNIPQVIQKYL